VTSLQGGSEGQRLEVYHKIIAAVSCDGGMKSNKFWVEANI